MVTMLGLRVEGTQAHRVMELDEPILHPAERGAEPPLLIFSGNSNTPLAQEICDYLGMALGGALVTTFKDEETRVRIEENVRGADVFVIQSTCSPVDHHIMELLIM